MKTTAKKTQRVNRAQANQLLGVNQADVGPLQAAAPVSFRPIEPALKDFVRVTSSRGYGCEEIARRCGDPVYAAEFGFKIRKLTRQTVHRIVSAMSQAEKIALRLSYYANCTKHPLMESHERVIELAKIALNEKIEPKTRVMALRAIREETGADAKLLADAIRDNGSALADVLRSAVHARIANATDADREHMRRNVLVALSSRDVAGQCSDN